MNDFNVIIVMANFILSGGKILYLPIILACICGKIFPDIQGVDLIS